MKQEKDQYKVLGCAWSKDACLRQIFKRVSIKMNGLKWIFRSKFHKCSFQQGLLVTYLGASPSPRDFGNWGYSNTSDTSVWDRSMVHTFQIFSYLCSWMLTFNLFNVVLQMYSLDTWRSASVWHGLHVSVWLEAVCSHYSWHPKAPSISHFLALVTLVLQVLISFYNVLHQSTSYVENLPQASEIAVRDDEFCFFVKLGPTKFWTKVQCLCHFCYLQIPNILIKWI